MEVGRLHQVRHAIGEAGAACGWIEVNLRVARKTVFADDDGLVVGVVQRDGVPVEPLVARRQRGP